MAGSDDLWDYQDDEGDGEEAPMKANDGYVYGPIEGEDVHAVPETFYDYSSSDDAESSDFAALDGEVGDYPAGQGEHHASLYNDSPADDAAGLIAKDHPGDRRLRADDEEASDNISPSKAPKNFFYHDPPHDH